MNHDVARPRIASFKLVALFALLVGACGAEPDEAGPADAVETISSPLTVNFDELQLLNGDRTRLLAYAPRASTACFFTRVGGLLQVPTQSMGLHNQVGPYWVVSASNETAYKWLSWVCVGVLASNQYTTHSWAIGLPPVDMGPSNDRVCFLKNVTGWFNGYGEELRIREANGRWLLDGTQGTQNPYNIGGGATCITSVGPRERSEEYSLTAPANGSAVLQTTYSTTSPDRNVCGLTRIGGKFDSFADRVTAQYAGANWFLEANADSSRVWMGVRCIDRTAY